jgi:hypothetical protein
MEDVINNWYEEHKLENVKIKERLDMIYDYNFMDSNVEVEEAFVELDYASNELEMKRKLIVQLIENIESLEKGKYVLVRSKVFSGSFKNEKTKLQYKKRISVLISEFSNDETELEEAIEELILYFIGKANPKNLVYYN